MDPLWDTKPGLGQLTISKAQPPTTTTGELLHAEFTGGMQPCLFINDSYAQYVTHTFCLVKATAISAATEALFLIKAMSNGR